MPSSTRLTPETLAILACPVCHASLTEDAETLNCIGCRRRYPVTDGIPILIASAATLPIQ